MRSPIRPLCSLALASTLLPLGTLQAQVNIVQTSKRPIQGCGPELAIEFIAPMITEEVPVMHGPSPNPDSFHVILEVSRDAKSPVQLPVKEGTYLPSPGLAAPLVTDVNGDGVIGDRHPAIPNLVLTMDDSLLVAGTLLPGGTNLASLIEMIGTEEEHGGDLTTTLTWIVDPTYVLIDVNGDMMTKWTAGIASATDTVTMKHGWDPLFVPFVPAPIHNPTISIFSPDWISTVDSDVPTLMETPWVVGVEVRIPCWFDPATMPPTPVPLDPVFGPCQGGTMACTGNFPPFPGPGFHPMFPSLDVRFSDDYVDAAGTFVPGGVITGGQCGVIWGSTGASLAYAFRQSSVHAWYGVNGVPDTTPLGGGDDQLIYRFTMNVDGMIFDTDVMPREMLITAAVETTSNCFSITNVRVKHRRDLTTRNP